MSNFGGVQDLILGPILFLLFYFFGRNHAAKKYSKSPLYKYFMNGLLLKMTGSVLAGMVFMFYYGGGDTIVYFAKGRFLSVLFYDNPAYNWIMLFPEFFKIQIINIPHFPVSFLDKENSYFIAKLVFLCNIFLFNSYYAIALCFSFFSFIGSWKLYKVFYYYYPKLHKEIAIATLYLPGLVLWGSGLFKDTIAFGALGMLIYCFHSIFVRKQYKAKYFIIGFMVIYTIGIVKAYILMALLPSLLFFEMNRRSANIKSAFIRTTIFPVVLFLVGIGSFGVLTLLNSTFTAYNLDNMETKIDGFQRWHTVRSEQTDGSGYSLGSSGNSPAELLLKFPLAVNATLFRPYIWESKKPIVFLAAIESLFVLFLTLNTFRFIGIKGTLNLLFSNPFISFCFVFSIIFAFAVGVSSYNFGALVRFKIPCMPFYVMAMYMSRHVSTLRK